MLEEKSGKIFDLKTLGGLLKFLGPYNVRFVAIITFTIISALLASARPMLIQYAIDNAIVDGNTNELFIIFIVLIGMLLGQSIIDYSNTYQSGWLGQNIIKNMRVKLYEHILRFRMSFFDKTPIGRLITRTVSDIETLADVFSQGMASLIGDILQIVFILSFMLFLNWKLTLVSLSILPLLFLATYIFKEAIKKSFNEVRVAVAQLNTFVQEHITGMNIVQIFNSEERELEKFKKINKEHLNANLTNVMAYSVYVPVAEVLSAMGIGLAVWYGSLGRLDDLIRPGDLVAFIMYITMFFRPVRQIADRINTLQQGIVSADRVLKLLDQKDFIANEGTTQKKELAGDVKFSNVWFAYKEQEYVLKGISFEVNKGKNVAFVGATGAGKSSVINVLNRFYDINQGYITIDGVNIEAFQLQNLRSNIGIVLQDVFLFADTIRNNITLGSDISHDKVVEVCKSLGAHEFIQKLPGNYDFDVKERGGMLSAGQRQLISFARAMITNPSILILDEATSSVDTETEEIIQKAIETMMKGRTSIIIAHRLSTIQSADKIIVLDQGKIIEEGNHDELLKKNGAYSKLYEMQYKEVLAS